MTERSSGSDVRALRPWPRDARPGEPPSHSEDLNHLPRHPTFTLAAGAHRAPRDEWRRMVNVPRGITLRQIHSPPGA